MLYGGGILSLSKCIKINTKRQVKKCINAFSKNTFELYLYSDPLNYIFIYYSTLWLGDMIFTNNYICGFTFIIRFAFDVLLSFVIIIFVDKLKLKRLFT